MSFIILQSYKAFRGFRLVGRQAQTEKVVMSEVYSKSEDRYNDGMCLMQ